MDIDAKRLLYDGNHTALHMCAERGLVEFAAELLTAGADTTIPDDKFAADALGWAEHCNQPGVAELIRAHRAAKPNRPKSSDRASTASCRQGTEGLDQRALDRAVLDRTGRAVGETPAQRGGRFMRERGEPDRKKLYDDPDAEPWTALALVVLLALICLILIARFALWIIAG